MKSKTQKLVLYALFSSITIVLSQISIPLPFTPVPINLALISVFTCACILGSYGGFISQFLYIILGAIGLPVFANFTGGFGILFGPTGGFIFSYPLCCIIIGFIVNLFGEKFHVYILAMASGLIVCYLLGTIWFSYYSNTSFISSLSVCVFPFILADIFKIILSGFLAKKLKGKIPV